MTISPNTHTTAPRISRRTSVFQESVIREMTRLGEEAGAINLSQGLPDFPAPAQVLAAAVDAIQRGDNQYTFPFGSPEFRAAIARKSVRYNGIPADPEREVTVTCGVSEAMIAAILALTDPGDAVVIFEPWYENYVPDCLMAGVRPRFVALHEPEYTFDPGELRTAFAERPRLVLLNSPHNPTGRVFTGAEMETIAALCQEFNVIAVTDEIYEHIIYDGRQHRSLGSLEGMHDRTVTISGLGKTYAVTGWRVGWVVASASLTEVIRKVHDYLTVCAPAPFQAAGVAALSLPETYYQAMVTEYTARRAVLQEALREAGFAFRAPEGAYYILADFSSVSWWGGAEGRPQWTRDRAFAEFLAREIGVAVVPGSSFYADGRGGVRRVRFNFAKEEDTLREAARRLRRLRSP